MSPISVEAAMHDYLATVRHARSKNTHATYSFALRAFQDLLTARGLGPGVAVSALTEDSISWFADYLKDQSPATEHLYLQAAKGFYNYLAAERLADINLPRRDLLKQPHLAKVDQIVATPTLVRKLPESMKKIIGDLSNTEKVLVGLDLRPRT